MTRREENPGDMADALPAITLTDPNNHDKLPSPAQSPTKDSAYGDLNARVRPGTPSGNAKSGHGKERHTQFAIRGECLADMDKQVDQTPAVDGRLRVG